MNNKIYLEFQEWGDLDKHLQKECYWVVRAKNPDDIPYGYDFEVVFMWYIDKDFHVRRTCDPKWGKKEDFLFGWHLDLPPAYDENEE